MPPSPLPPLRRWVLLGGLALLVAAPAWAQEDETAADRQSGQLLVRGMTRAFLGDDEGAVDLFREALTHSPDNAAILGAMATAQRRLGDTGSALLFARRAAQLSPDDPEAQLLVAELLGDDGDIPAAVEVLRTLASRFPDEPDVLRFRAALLYRSEQRTAARDAYRELVERVGGEDGDLERLLELETSLGRLDAALDVLDDLARRRPGDAALLQRRAEILAQLGRTEEAAAAFERVLVLAPGNRDAMEALDALRPDSGDDRPRLLPAPERSADEWLAVVAGDPRNVDAWRAAVRALAREGRVMLALGTADDGLLLFPGDVDLEIEAGMAALLAVLPDRATDHFSEAAMVIEERDGVDRDRLDAARAGSWLAACLAGRDRDMPDEVATALDRADPAAHVLAFGSLCLAESDPRRAGTLASVLLTADPSNPFGLAARARALSADGRAGEAGQALEPLERDGAAPLLLMTAGDVASAAGRPQEATALYERAAAGSPTSRVIRSRLERP